MNLNATQTNATASYTTDKPLKLFIELITGIIPIAYIFECPSDETGTRLIIILDQYRFQRNEETKNILAFLGLSQINIEIMYYHYGMINDMLQQGNLFFAKYINRNNCLYQHTATHQLPEYSETTLNTLKASCKVIIKNATEKVMNFFDGASLYYRQGELHLAAFMLHQTCEQMLRLIIKLFNGKEYKSHQLAQLQKTAGFYFPKIKNIFHSKNNKELQWLEILQQAYVGARYDDNYTIDSQHLLFLQSKIGSMLNKVNEELLLITS